MELVKMSDKGQLVVPQDIREKLALKPGDRFLSYEMKDGVAFKKVNYQEILQEFKRISGKVQKEFKKRGITPADVDEAVRWARKRS